MHRSLRTCCLLIVALVGLAHAPFALGLANRVFVSARSGSDANSCDNVKTPCKTFAGAVMQLYPGGEAIVLDSGGYGPVTITNSVTLEAPPGVLAFIHASSGDAVKVEALGAAVVLRGLTINGSGTSGYGVEWAGSGSLSIENCVIKGFGWSGIHVGTVGDAMLFLKDTTVRGAPGSGGDGVRVFPEKDAGNLKISIDRCHVEDTSHGGHGIYLLAESGTSVRAVIRDSVLAFNGLGLLVIANEGGSMQALVDRCSVFGGYTGMFVENPGVVLRVTRSSVTHNSGNGLSQHLDAVLETIGNNMVRGNAIDEDGVVTIRAGD